MERSRQRQSGGRPIGDLQAVQHLIAGMDLDVYQARATSLVAQTRLDQLGPFAIPLHRDVPRLVSLVKVINDEAFFRVSDRAVQVHGASGLRRGSPEEKLFRVAQEPPHPGGDDRGAVERHRPGPPADRNRGEQDLRRGARPAWYRLARGSATNTALERPRAVMSLGCVTGSVPARARPASGALRSGAGRLRARRGRASPIPIRAPAARRRRRRTAIRQERTRSRTSSGSWSCGPPWTSGATPARRPSSRSI